MCATLDGFSRMDSYRHMCIHVAIIIKEEKVLNLRGDRGDIGGAGGMK